LVKIKWFLERIRASYEKDFVLLETGKKQKREIELGNLLIFLNKALISMFNQLYPEVGFELANPVLDILKMLYTYFGTARTTEIRKGVFLKPL
jgi:hypothetical protein